MFFTEMMEKDKEIEKSEVSLFTKVFWIIVIILLIILAYLIYLPDKATIKEAKCIGENSKVYTLLGCSFCVKQKNMFGDNWKYLNSTDCFYNEKECLANNITEIPVWFINEKEYKGVLSLKLLKELTNC